MKTLLAGRGAAKLLVGACLLPMALAAGAARAQAQPDGPPPRFPVIVNNDAAYQAAMTKRANTLAKLAPLTDKAMRSPTGADWPMWRRTYDGRGFSPLSQINRKNAATIKPAWTWTLPLGPDEITPVAYGGVIFIASGGQVQAIDGVTGDLIWQYVRPNTPGYPAGAAIARSIALYDDMVIAPTADRHLVALNMKTGKVVWDHEVVPASDPGPHLSGGPIAVHGKLIQGVSSCNAVKGGCYIVGLDAKTGAEVWRFQTIARPGQPGGDSWNGAPVDQRFGGAVWNSGTYDPDLNLVYFGIGQTYDTATLLQPHAQKGESSDALYTDSTVALDPDTGKLVWHYQHFNRDVWDFDWSFERVLVDLPVGGKTRKLAVTGGKIAIFDAIDRTNGAYLFSKDLGLQTLVTSIDPKTGRKKINPALEPEAGKTKTVCPHAGGARNWLATAYDPSAKMLYVPLTESCMDFTWKPRSEAQTAAGGNDINWVLKARPDSDGNFGRVEAINLQTGKVAWTRRHRTPEASSILATAGGLVFEGSRDRLFRASDSATGKVLWSTRLNAAPSSTPITYAVDGQQYIAVVAGGGGSLDGTWGGLTPELETPSSGTTLWVFKAPSPPRKGT